MKMVVYTKAFLLILVIGTSSLYAQQQDTAKKELPRIYLTGRDVEIMPGGMSFNPNGGMSSYSPIIIRKNFYKMKGFDKPVRVNYLASNLALDLKPVPEAYRSIQTYQACRVATPLFMVVGAVTLIASIAYGINNQTQNELGEYNEMDMTGVFVGIGIAVGSWIPYLASMGGVERAVNKYNRDPRVKE